MRRFTITSSLCLLGCLMLMACSQQPSQARLATLSNASDLPDECQGCWERFKECVDLGDDLVHCEQEMLACSETCGAPPPPQECYHCAAGYDGCTGAAASADDEFDCVVGIEACLRVCVEDEPHEPPNPEPGDCDSCERTFEECVDREWEQGDDGSNDPQRALHECEEILDQCRARCEPPQPQPEPCYECRMLLEECSADSNSEPNDAHCADLEQKCHEICEPPQPDPCGDCQRLLDECEVTSEDQADRDQCTQIDNECLNLCDWTDPPEPGGEPDPRNDCETSEDACV